jgi:uracil-DNA glycosylase
MKSTINIEDIKNKLYKKLEPSGWGRILKSFIFSSDFDNIIKELGNQVNHGKRFTPTFKNMFRAFEECPYDKLKVIVVGQDPYPTPGVADGIAFSCKNTPNLQPSIRYILTAINDTVYDGNATSHEKDLTRWANQGVLLLNTALTTTVSKSGQHFKIWQPFIAYLFDWLNWHNPGIVYIYTGKKAEEWKDSVSDNNYKLIVSHPASAAYNKQQKWDCKDVFNETNKIMHNLYGEKITW